MIKKALITGITGQDGSYLAELLLEKGYEVHGMIRYKADRPEVSVIDHIKDKLHLHFGDMTDFASIQAIFTEVNPDEVYNLAAQSHAGHSFKMPLYTTNVCGMGVLRLLEIIRQNKPDTKLFQASTSEFLGGELPWNEDSKIVGNNPYAYGKIMGYHAVKNYRDSYGIYAANGIGFNHESPRRGEEFVTRKITKAVADIKAGRSDKLLLGNIEAKRDWGYAPEYMEAAWLILQQDEPDDFVIATGESHSVREWMEAAFESQGLDPYKYYEQNEEFMRPSDIPEVRGDASKIKEKLGWVAKTKYKDLVKLMVEHDLCE